MVKNVIKEDGMYIVIKELWKRNSPKENISNIKNLYLFYKNHAPGKVVTTEFWN